MGNNKWHVLLGSWDSGAAFGELLKTNLQIYTRLVCFPKSVGSVAAQSMSQSASGSSPTQPHCQMPRYCSSMNSFDQVRSHTSVRTLYKLSTGDAIPAKRMMQLPSVENVRCQMVLLSGFKPADNRIPESMGRRLQMVSITHCSRTHQVNKLGRWLTKRCGDCMLCWIA